MIRAELSGCRALARARRSNAKPFAYRYAQRTLNTVSTLQDWSDKAGETLLTLHEQAVDDAKIYTVELKNEPDNRLTTQLVTAYLDALDVVEKRWRLDCRNSDREPAAGQAALITTGLRNKDRFFSNGLDFGAAMATPGFFASSFNPLLSRVLSYPLPTIAAIQGHAFAGGLIFAIAHDYRVAKHIEGAAKGKIMLSTNEVDFGFGIPHATMMLLKAKLAPQALRDAVFTGRRFGAAEAQAAGLVDQLAPSGQATVEAAIRLAAALAVKAPKQAIGVMKQTVYRTELDLLMTETEDPPATPALDIQAALARLGSS
ncbi:uncharacterized protein L969DRAFT_83673 [Mixia osmundae IAM 14324]|uniref:Enoyl-CoA hydratase n=1 Tax=Mixia osmundae (strain CBS 9802 / IAM 14324 / JCM 22182 / KY 12970) TaxID=764103 RepID=G7E4M6_MIXOS|nr:uncharacterized protein L969DRAFT_83673 [Mixia osmundae IAM 14324]KEI41834.1 hypothetical protein L969DRAFT_83673 [Mixia osmundae IAM 14324]GAA97786.1 hypothetical protein E5Q_04465 [Mixia osmundae IAM 14324]